MQKENKEIIKLTANQVLLTLFDLALPFFEASRIYRISAKKMKKQIEYERSDFKERIKYLRRQGLIRNLIEGKEKYFEITTEGIDKAKNVSLNRITIKHKERWDRKWRVVIFDIPEKHRTARDILRTKLLALGFETVQESVYVYPFECSEEIAMLSYLLGEENNILVMISEIIQGENFLIENFYKKGILKISDLKKV